jgi:hypothetical protein
MRTELTSDAMQLWISLNEVEAQMAQPASEARQQCRAFAMSDVQQQKKTIVTSQRVERRASM